MKKNSNSLPTSITTIDDVREFFNYLYLVEELLFHPKYDFGEYIDSETNKPAYTAKEARERNILMHKCFEVCSENDFNIFTVALEVYRKNRNDKKTSSKKTQSNVVVCILNADFVDDSTGEVLSFLKNKTYDIYYDDPICLHIELPGFDSLIPVQRGVFEKHFRYAEKDELA